MRENSESINLPKVSHRKRGGWSNSSIAGDVNSSRISRSDIPYINNGRVMIRKDNLWGLSSQWIEGLSSNRMKRLIPPIFPEIRSIVNIQNNLFENAKKSQAKMTNYGYFSHIGAFRLKNEDRVVIHSSDSSDKSLQVGFNFFGIFDGHGGEGACQFAHENIQQDLLECIMANLEKDPIDLLKSFIRDFDKKMRNFLSKDQKDDRSGTCCLFICSFLDRTFVVNIGDSRAIIQKGGRFPAIEQLTQDHRPEVLEEADRIIRNGGYVYRNHFPSNSRLTSMMAPRKPKKPLRVFPGDLSVSRALGDFDIKEYFPNVIISDPDVFEMSEEFEYIILASDGVFDILTNQTIGKLVSETLQNMFSSVVSAIETILSILFQELVRNYCSDNITIIFIAGSKFSQLANTIEIYDEF